MAQPLVSICLPNLNNRVFLEERMRTLLAQTTGDWELIVCDSHSDDGSWEFFQKFETDPRVRLCQVPREGLYAGWNECLRRARGEYVYMATSDDTCEPTLLEELLDPLEKRSDLALSVCDHVKISEDGAVLREPPSRAREFLGDWVTRRSIRPGKTEFLLHACFSTLWVTVTAVLFRRSLLERIGLFRTDLGHVADQEWTLRASLATDIAWLPKKLATWRIHSKQATGLTWTREDCRFLLKGLENVLNDGKAGIPEEWMRFDGWREKIARVRRGAFRERLDLYRWIARSRPLEFLANAAEALRFDLPWFFRQMGTGFAGGEELNVDTIHAARSLLEELGAAWPPTAVDSQWRPIGQSA